MSWKPWKLDVANELKSEVKPKFIKLHPMSMELVISIDSKAEGELKKDPRFMVSMMGLCKMHGKTAVNKMKDVLTHADKQAAGFTNDGTMASLFLRPIHMEMEKYFDDGSEDIQKEVGDLFAQKRKDAEFLKKGSIKVDLDVKFEGLEIPQKGGENKKKVVGGGAIKLAALDVDLDKDIDLSKLRALLTKINKTATEITASLADLMEVVKEGEGPKGGKEPDKEQKETGKALQNADKNLAETQKSLARVEATLRQTEEALKKAEKQGKSGEDAKKKDEPDVEKLKVEQKRALAEKKRLETVLLQFEGEKKRLEGEKATAEKEAKAEEKSEDDKVKQAKTRVNALLKQHKDAFDDAAQEWKEKAVPLKEADRLIREWEQDVAENKSKFAPAVKSQIVSELGKLKQWSGPLMKYRVGLSTAFKDTGIAKKFTDARDQVLEQKSSWKELAAAAEDWGTDVSKQLITFEKELKISAHKLDESVKKVTKLVNQKA